MYQKLLSILAIATTVLAGFVSAATPGLERESCIVSDEVYDQVATMQIQYTDELAAEHYETAQAIYDEMQTLINEECGNTDGIVSLQTSSQSSTCAMQLNQLLTYYTYNMVELGREGIAASIRQNIESYLQDNACDELAANGTGPDALALNALLEATIDQTPNVIPYSGNICFLDNTVDDFVEQINNIAEQNVIESVDTVVDGLFNTNGGDAGVILSPETQERQNTILTYARLVIESKMLEWASGNDPVFSELFEQYLAGGVTNTLNALIQSDGLDGLFQLILNGPDLLAYYDAMKLLYPSRNDFATALDTNANISYTRNPVTAGFDIGSSDNGLQFIMPVTAGSGDGASGNFIATYRYYDGITALDHKEEEVLLPTRIIGDITNNDVQQMAFDVQATYDENNKPSNISVDLYFNPYIIHFDISIIALENGDTQIDVDMQSYGPASCDFNIQLSMINAGDIFDTNDELDHPTQSVSLTAAINNGLITRNVTDSQARNDAIDAYELSSGISDPVAAAAGNAYFDADIYINETHVADINAMDNMFGIAFIDILNRYPNNPNVYNNNLIDTYIMAQELDVTNIMLVLTRITQAVEQAKSGVRAPVEEEVNGGSLLTQCRDKAGANVEGYYYYTDLDVMVSTYCLPAYDTCGEYDYTGIDGLDLYYRAEGKDTTTCYNLVSTSTGTGSNPTPAPAADMPGCTDPAASNYNSKATVDDGSCIPVATGSGETSTGSSEPTPVLGCTDPAATNYDPTATQDDGSCIIDSGDMGQGSPDPVLGCTDPAADNYDPSATQDDGSCTYPPVEVPGCTDPAANNYDAAATQDNGSCTYDEVW